MVMEPMLAVPSEVTHVEEAVEINTLLERVVSSRGAQAAVSTSCRYGVSSPVCISDQSADPCMASAAHIKCANSCALGLTRKSELYAAASHAAPTDGSLSALEGRLNPSSLVCCIRGWLTSASPVHAVVAPSTRRSVLLPE